jgi:hypothetical protein
MCPACVPRWTAKSCETLESDEHSKLLVRAALGPFCLMGDLHRIKLIIRRSEVRVLPAPPRLRKSEGMLGLRRSLVDGPRPRGGRRTMGSVEPMAPRIASRKVAEGPDCVAPMCPYDGGNA